MTLCREIAGTLNRSDIARFESSFKNEKVASLLEENPVVQHCLFDLFSERAYSTEKLAAGANAAHSAPSAEVVQVVPHGYGYLVKMANAPMVSQPQQVQMSAPQAQAAVGPEMVQQADQQGMATVTNVPAMPDPMVETPEPALRFGIYKCLDATSQKEIIGFVIPKLFNPMTGQPVEMALFTNGSAYAIQPQIKGVFTALNMGMPAMDVPRGMGVFYTEGPGGALATVPFLVQNSVTIEGKTAYAAKTQEGLDIQIVVSPELKVPVMSSQNEIAIPANYKFLPLDNQIQVDGGDNMMKQAQADAYHTMVEIRAGRDGLCDLRGPVFEKAGSGLHNVEDAVFWLASAGCPQNISLACIEKSAHESAPVRLFGLHPLSTYADLQRETMDKAANALAAIPNLPERQNLFTEIIAITSEKSASTMMGVSTVDSVLALNFLNPENIASFVQFIPQLEDSQNKIAKLVLMTQLGLQSVPLNAAVRAMQGLQKVIEGLKGLKQYSV